jgi:hypothetical protein
MMNYIIGVIGAGFVLGGFMVVVVMIVEDFKKYINKK